MVYVQTFCVYCNEPVGVILVDSPNDFHSIMCQKCFIDEAYNKKEVS